MPRHADPRSIVTRFAPSPTGHLHLGHGFAALFAADIARRQGGRFLLRIEDIDHTRCRPEFADAILEDLAWLGVAWAGPVRRQSEHLDDHTAALAALERKGLIYPCFCTRAEVQAEIARAGGAPQGPEGAVYPGTCRRLGDNERAARIEAGESHALRLDMATATAMAGPLVWHDGDGNPVAAHPAAFGDIVLARKETPTSYHLAVTVDDHLQGVTVVTRGADLLAATDIHRLLQALLGYDSPRYAHHRLLKDSAGQRLAKRSGGTTIRSLRERGVTPEEVREMTGFERG